VKKAITILVFIVAGLTVLSAAGAIAWFLRQRENTFYTDADSIQEPLETASLRDILWTPAVDLGPRINDSALDDSEPAIGADGSELLFVRTSASGDADIVASRRDGGGWSQPEPIDAINSEYDDLGPEMSRDGSTVLFYSNRPGGFGGYDIWMSRRTAGGWGEPQNLGPAINSFHHDYAPAINGAGTTLFFSSNRPKESGDVREAARVDYDLYRVAISTEYDADGYTLQKVEGDATSVAELNTRADETSPATSPFDDFLYFASNREGGSGGFDLYRARVVRDQILPPLHLGESVNSEWNELDPAIDRGGFGMYFASDRPYAHGDLEAGDGRATYNLYYSTSREVFRETAAFNWPALWEAIAPSLLWLLLAILLLLGLLYLLKRIEYRRLNLLARCLLASLFVHLLIMFLMSLWGVTASLSDALRDSGVRIALTSSAHSDSLAEQMRGNLTELAVAAPNDAPSEQQSEAQAIHQPVMETAPSPLAERNVARTEQSTARAQAASDANASEPHIQISRPIDVERTAVNDSVPTPQAASPARADEANAPTPRATATPLAARHTAEAQLDSHTPELSERSFNPEQSPSSDPAQTLASEAAVTETRPAETTPIHTNSPADAIATRPADPDLAIPQPQRSAGGAVAEAELAVRTEAPALHNASPQRFDLAAIPPSQQESLVTTPAAQKGDPVAPESIASPAPAARESQTPIESTGVAQAASADQISSVTEVAFDVAMPNETEANAAIAHAEPEMGVEAAAVASASQAARASPGVQRETADAVPLDSFNPESASASSSTSLLAVDSVEASEVAPLEAAPLDVALPTEFDSTEPMVPASDLPTLEDDAVRLTRAEQSLDVRAMPMPAAAVERAAREEAKPDRPDRPDIAIAPQQTLRNDPSEAEQSRTLVPLMNVEAVEPANAPRESGQTTELARVEVADFPSIARILETLDIPMDKALERNPLEQRSPEVRTELVKERGGDDKTENAVALALEWLAKHQSRDGRWDADNFDHTGECGGETDAQVDIAITSLALLAFLGADYTHTRESEYQANVAGAIDWLVRQQDASGSLLGIESRETMYSHGIASIALAEAFAMTGDPNLINPVLSAIDFIVAARNTEYGGWRYAPQQAGDTSVTGWQVMAMASAARSDIEIPRDALLNAARWIEMVKHPREPGRYAYQPGRQYTDAMTAEAMFVRQLLGVPRSDGDMQASAQYLLENLPDWKRDPNTYYWYYGTLAMFHYQGAGWDRWNRALKRELIENQRKDGAARGSWDPVDQWAKIGGRVYQTAICALCLEIYYRYDPIYAAEEIIDTFGIIQGVVTDATTNEPLEGAQITLDLPDREALTTRSGVDGRYVISAPEMPEFFALSASKRGYSPLSAAASVRELRGRTMTRNFALAPLSESVIAVEEVPEVHHLGNNLFEGRINSQFQSEAEGTLYSATFTMRRSQLPPNFSRAEVRLLVKGAQARNRIRINGNLLRQRMNESPSDGSYGEFAAPVPIEWLRQGANEISIEAVNDTGDIDDFEFINVRIELFED